MTLIIQNLGLFYCKISEMRTGMKKRKDSPTMVLYLNLHCYHGGLILLVFVK